MVYTAGGTDILDIHVKKGSSHSSFGSFALTLIMRELNGGILQCWVAVKKQFAVPNSAGSSPSFESRLSFRCMGELGRWPDHSFTFSDIVAETCESQCEFIFAKLTYASAVVAAACGCSVEELYESENVMLLSEFTAICGCSDFELYDATCVFLLAEPKKS